MVRSFTPTMAAEIAKPLGTEPMIIVAVKWTDVGDEILYSDRKISPVQGKIISISKIDNVFSLDDNSDSQQVSIILDDADGSLKEILNNHDVHNQPVYIYHWYANISINDRVLIFKGLINSPILWNEGDRTVKFSVLSQIEGAEVGFSSEGLVGDSGQNPDLAGKVWPMAFGTVKRVPALRLTGLQEGTLETPVGVTDFTIQPQLSFISSCGACPTIDTLNILIHVRDYASGINYSSAFWGTASLEEDEVDFETQIKNQRDCQEKICLAQAELQWKLNRQNAVEQTWFAVKGFERFPQGETITLEIDGALFTGYFDGTTEEPSFKFIIVSRQHGKFDELGGLPSGSEVASIYNQEVLSLLNSDCGLDERLLINYNEMCGSDTERARKDFWKTLQKWPKAGFHDIKPGATVTLQGSAEVIYVVNMLPSTVTRVMAKKRFSNGQEAIVDVPASLWTSRVTSYDTFTATEIVFTKPLSVSDPEWDDGEVYVSMVSSVGPDIVDILEWLISRYTPFTIDIDSFEAVQLDLTGVEANFALLDGKNIFDLLKEIAFQAKCAIYVRDETIYLQYLPKRSMTTDLITESDVLSNTLELFYTDTEDLVTRLIANWRDDYSLEEPNRVILRYNIARYGLHDKTFEFYIYNTPGQVENAALFWLIRLSQIWRKVRFTTPLTKLQLETFDTTELQLPDLSPNDIYGWIEEASYDTNDHMIHFECWTPILSGQQTEFDYSFPDDLEVDFEYADLQGLDTGDFIDSQSPDFNGFAPLAHPLTEPETPVGGGGGGGGGDERPDDLGDQYEPNLPYDPIEPYEPSAPGNDSYEDCLANCQDAIPMAPFDYCSGDQLLFDYLDEWECTPTNHEDCTWKIRVTVWNVTSIVDLIRGTDEIDGDGKGWLAGGNLIRFDIYHFDSFDAADSFRLQIIEEHRRRNQDGNGDYSVGEEAPITASFLDSLVVGLRKQSGECCEDNPEGGLVGFTQQNAQGNDYTAEDECNPPEYAPSNPE